MDVFFDSIFNSLSTYHPESKIVILGIASGGLPLSEQLYNIFKDRGYKNIQLEEISCRRPSTSKKKKNKFVENSLRFIFRLLPTSLLNFMRNMEHRKLSKRLTTDLERSLIVMFDATILAESDLILVVDDAVDSGATFKQVLDFIKNACVKGRGDPTIKTISVAVTQSNPLVNPDYVWRRDVLVRFPWSLDG